MKNYKELLKNITTLIFDYDGVLTDGRVLTTDQGDQLRTGYVRDGYAIQLAIKKGLNVAVISGGTSESIVRRCETIRLNDVFIGVFHKTATFNRYLESKNAMPREVMYMGDDIPDIPVMKLSGLPTCPADAAEEVKQISLYVSSMGGGQGCVRDIIEQVLKAQGKWMDQDAFEW